MRQNLKDENILRDFPRYGLLVPFAPPPLKGERIDLWLLLFCWDLLGLGLDAK